MADVAIIVENDQVLIAESTPTVIEITPTISTPIEIITGAAFNITQTGGGIEAEPYLHTQSVASDVWVINHVLGYRPAIQVYSPGGELIRARVLHISDFQAQVRFSVPTTGFVIAGD